MVTEEPRSTEPDVVVAARAFAAGTIVLEDLLRAVRRAVHSMKDSERSAAVSALGALGEPNVQRELGYLYRVCQWR